LNNRPLKHTHTNAQQLKPIKRINAKICGIINGQFAQGQIDYLLVKFGYKLEEKLAKVYLALPGRVN
jgi:hypothetical protein